MALPKTNKTLGRDALKKFFRHGEIPTENHYRSLIDSMLNRQDDGFARDDQYGFVLGASPAAGRFISFVESMDDLSPFFTIEKDSHESAGGLRISPGNAGEGGSGSFYLHSSGNLGIGKRCPGPHRMDVQGFAGMEGRAGTFRRGAAPADGKWHSIVKRLDNCQAFEVVARTGTKAAGRFAIMHAIVLHALGKSRGGIRRTGSHFGFFWNRIRVRWKATTNHQYELQIKTSSNYGPDVNIHYHVARLWDDERFLPEEYYF